MAKLDPANTDERERRTTHRSIIERIVITGLLRLETPTSLGNGDADAFTDSPLLLDEVSGQPILLGTSLAGALRNYLRERERGFEVEFPERIKPINEEKKKQKEAALEKERQTWAVRLFGGHRGDDEGGQSPLIVYDAEGDLSGVEFRDGVAIDGKTRTAKDQEKFDSNFLAAGSTFGLRLELLITLANEAEQGPLETALGAALHGLASGEVALGGRKRRGFGQCSASEWQVRRYKMNEPSHLLAWLAADQEKSETWVEPVVVKTGGTIWEALGSKPATFADQRNVLTLTAKFALNSSVLIRSGFSDADTDVDVSHLRSGRPGRAAAPEVISGTSWAGVLRARANKIVRTLAGAGATANNEIVENLFGHREVDPIDQRGGRISVAETEVQNGIRLVQNRIKIDRFTGGTFPTALFEEKPVFGQTNTVAQLSMSVHNPTEAEVGLLLLLLKDLWTGDLPVGGGANIGRGFLAGRHAEICWGDTPWIFEQTDGASLKISGVSKVNLQQYVDVLGKAVKP